MPTIAEITFTAADGTLATAVAATVGNSMVKPGYSEESGAGGSSTVQANAATPTQSTNNTGHFENLTPRSKTDDVEVHGYMGDHGFGQFNVFSHRTPGSQGTGYEARWAQGQPWRLYRNNVEVGSGAVSSFHDQNVRLRLIYTVPSAGQLRVQFQARLASNNFYYNPSNSTWQAAEVDLIDYTDTAPLSEGGAAGWAYRLNTGTPHRVSYFKITGEAPVAADLTGGVSADDAVSSGQLGSGASTVSGDVSTAEAVASGALGLQLSTVSSLPFTRNPGNGGRLANLANVAVAVMSDDANLQRLAGHAGLLMAANGRVTFTNGVPVPPGTSVILLTREAGPNGSLGVERYITQA